MPRSGDLKQLQYMYQYLYPFGHQVFGETLGEAWTSLMTAILKDGEYSFDEGRNRLALQTVRVKSMSQQLPDELILKYGERKNLDSIINLTFDKDEMWDFDVIPSFPPGAKSYYCRLKDGGMVEFVVKRLSRFPESKKAVIVFPTYDDYNAVLAAPKDDYFPCIVSIQFRVVKNKNKKLIANTIVYARSIDAYQKAHGNLWAIAMLTHEVVRQLSKNLKKEVEPGFLDLLIADAHIYEETEVKARQTIKRIKEKKCKY